MADMSNISAIQHENVDKQNFPTKTMSADVFDQLMLEQIAGQAIKKEPVSLSKNRSDKSEDAFSGADNDRHIDAFIQQALSQAPETEKRIWARMKEELGI